MDEALTLFYVHVYIYNGTVDNKYRRTGFNCENLIIANCN